MSISRHPTYVASRSRTRAPSWRSTRPGLSSMRSERAPEITSYLQTIIDSDPVPGRWILTGSAALCGCWSRSSQSARGAFRGFAHLLPLCWQEICRFDGPPVTLDEALLHGGYPRIFDRQLDPVDWLTALRRDLRRTRCAPDCERGRPRRLPAFRCPVRRPNCAIAQLLEPRRRYGRLASRPPRPGCRSWKRASSHFGYAASERQPAQASRQDAPSCTSTTAASCAGCLGIRNAGAAAQPSAARRPSSRAGWSLEIARHRANAGERAGMHHCAGPAYGDGGGPARRRAPVGPRVGSIGDQGACATVTARPALSLVAGRIAEVARRARPAERRRRSCTVATVRQERSDCRLLPWNADSCLWTRS
jgi:hypothetical protein